MLETCVNTPEYLDLFQGPSFTTMILGYLANIWNVTCAPEAAQQQAFGVPNQRLDGYIDMSAQPTGTQISVASISITEVPPDTDMVFRKSDILFLGYCGFGATRTTGTFIQTGAGAISVFASQSPVYFHESKFINHANTIWFPPKPQCNVFWWSLKRGVVADISVEGTSTGSGASTQWGPWMHFNPMRGGWNAQDDEMSAICSEGVTDGCGYPVDCHSGGGGSFGGPGGSDYGGG